MADEVDVVEPLLRCHILIVVESLHHLGQVHRPFDVLVIVGRLVFLHRTRKRLEKSFVSLSKLNALPETACL